MVVCKNCGFSWLDFFTFLSLWFIWKSNHTKKKLMHQLLQYLKVCMYYYLDYILLSIYLPTSLVLFYQSWVSNLNYVFCNQTCTVVKSKGKISQNSVAFSEYMNFNDTVHWFLSRNLFTNNSGYFPKHDCLP